ncbi:hypothetical protein [Seonamhaeicola aphaedonensis]|uniref:Uncharacterized protein n=1 Tax=Seonamhaeicola aphaedonensis TaxID=1461338 RepID=A0A3D9HKP4_9FLAO|nr:hypothetical protein [Seonamhaeicola aphaedonensis]RED50043.1 hypothetical protein DFQ02_10163 [Seonamhaeicola aphaedonensis]
MKIKFTLLIIAFSTVFFAFAQTNLNNYKYVIVPNRFDFLKKKDQYQLNSLAEFLFKKHGFNAFLEGEDYPEDLKRNRCLALRSDVSAESGMFKTKLKIELKDCNDQTVYTSPFGESRDKEYEKAYNAALRQAFEGLGKLNYNYVPNKGVSSLNSISSTPQESDVKNEVSEEIKELKAEIETLKKAKQTVQVEAKKEALVVIQEPKKEVVTAAPPKNNNIKPTKTIEDKTPSDVLYAQPITNGFQLVDSSPKVVYKINKTGIDSVFLVEGKNAIVYKKGNSWVIEYYEEDTMKTEALNIKF